MNTECGACDLGNCHLHNPYNSQVLDKLVSLGYLVGYRITKKYEEPGVESRTSEEIMITFPMGATLTISGVSSGVMENITLQLKPGHILLEE